MDSSLHILASNDTPYDFEEGWTTIYFYPSGKMPSIDLLSFFQSNLQPHG
jgi:hypothetical protein